MVEASQLHTSFAAGVSCIFDKWTSLQLAIEHGWGGMQTRKKALSFYNDVLDLFSAEKRIPSQEQLATYLDDRLLNLFCIESEDDGPDEVASLLLELWTKCQKGDSSLWYSLHQQAKSDLSLSRECHTGINHTDNGEPLSECESDTDAEPSESTSDTEIQNEVIETPDHNQNIHCSQFDTPSNTLNKVPTSQILPTAPLQSDLTGWTWVKNSNKSIHFH